MDARPWQLQLIDKSLKKKEKLKHLTSGLRLKANSLALDLGCAQGVLTYFLKRRGGWWVSADQDMTNLKSTRSLVDNPLVKVEPSRLPFRSGRFDFIALPDYLEHVTDDLGLLAEVRRILKPGGALVVVVPQTGPFHVLHRLKAALGMKLEFYGHKREGYSLKDLASRLRQSRFEITAHKSYAKFFSESCELLLNFFYKTLMPPPTAETLRDGHIRPATAEEFRSRRKTFRLYALVYPLLRMTSQLDHLLFFLKGYSLIVWARAGVS